MSVEEEEVRYRDRRRKLESARQVHFPRLYAIRLNIDQELGQARGKVYGRYKDN